MIPDIGSNARAKFSLNLMEVIGAEFINRYGARMVEMELDRLVTEWLHEDNPQKEDVLKDRIYRLIYSEEGT